jgi:hypothetical protein
MKMAVGKSSGSNGFSMIFYQEHWDTIGMDLWLVIEESCQMRGVLQALNATFSIVITKKENSRSMNQFKGISLYNCYYKIISNIIANITKPNMEKLISNNKGVTLVDVKLWMQSL